jgi:hypothetical protein
MRWCHLFLLDAASAATTALPMYECVSHVLHVSEVSIIFVAEQKNTALILDHFMCRTPPVFPSVIAYDVNLNTLSLSLQCPYNSSIGTHDHDQPSISTIHG